MKLAYPELFQEQCLIGDSWVKADSSKTIAVRNPATAEIMGHVPDMGAKETVRAIAQAHAAFPIWSGFAPKDRAKLMRDWYDLIMKHQADLARLMTTEQGKPLKEAEGEVAYAASFIEWFGEEAKRVYGCQIPAPKTHQHIYVSKAPVGVVGAITPWNFPAAMITRKVGPALAAGCTVVLKPSEFTPFSALALAKLAEEAGIPAGVLNIVTGDAEIIGGVLTESNLVRKISFTGSTRVGKLLMKQCADTMKRVSLELGGNAPFIVFDDADINEAVKGLMASKYRNSGQTCICPNRVLVQAGIYERFVAELLKAVAGLNVGNGADEDVTQGPLIYPKAVEKVEHLLADAVAKGATILLGGKRHKLGGLFFEPTVIAGVTADMDMASQEIFGPVSALYKFTTEEEAIAFANATNYGLAAYFYTQDVGRIMRVSHALQYGMIGINEGAISNEVMPFGGIKESGMGREGSYLGIEEYLEIKSVMLKI